MTSAATTAARPLCADVSAAAGEDLGATASRVEHWLLVEYGGYWPYEPLDASVFGTRLREHLRAQLAVLPRSRLLLVKQPGRLRPASVRVFYGTTPERGARFFELELARHSELADLDLGAALRGDGPGTPLDHPLLLVCTHGKRDRCCAGRGQPLCRALHAHAPKEWLWQSSHVGGDRFAGNVVALPEGAYFGRVRPADVPSLLPTYREGRLRLDLYRGRSCHSLVAQAAEVAVRRAPRLPGLTDLRQLAVARIEPNVWRVEFLAELAGVVHEVEIGIEHGEPRYLTCRATERRAPRRFAVRAHRMGEVAA